MVSNTMQMCSITRGWLLKCTISTDNCFLDTLVSHLPSLQIRTCGCRQQQCGIMAQSKRPRQLPDKFQFLRIPQQLEKCSGSLCTNQMSQVYLSRLPPLWEPFPQGVCVQSANLSGLKCYEPAYGILSWCLFILPSSCPADVIRHHSRLNPFIISLEIL